MRRLRKELWPVSITIFKSDDEFNVGRDQWLVKNVGIFQDKWNAVYWHNRTDYYFRSEQDATIFSLKWQ